MGRLKGESKVKHAARFFAVMFTFILVASVTASVASADSGEPIVFRAYDTGYASNTAGGIAPWKWYGLNDNAPIMVAKKNVMGPGTGAVVAMGFDGTASYYGSISYPSADNLDVLFDITFQWMVPGATKILWYDGDSSYSAYKTTGPNCKKMLDNLRVKKGYTIDNGNMLRLDNLGLYTTYDILVINQEQMGDKTLGGDPSLLWDNELTAIRNWVNGGKGLIVQEASDYLNYCYNRVSNRILDNVGFGWWYQHDTINDATRNDLAASYKPLVVRVVGNPIGDNYAAQTGRENILAYKSPTLIPRPVPTLISPENCNDILDTTPTFMWTSVSDPSGVTYQIQIDNGVDLIMPDFLLPVYDFAGIKENTYTLPDENALEICVHYWWRVRATDNAGIGKWSEEWHFHVVPIGAIGVLLMPLLMLLPLLLVLRRQNRRYHY